MKNEWRGELGSYVDSAAVRRDSFNAWLAWEFLQRGIAGDCEEMQPAEIAELCGKTKVRTRVLLHGAIKHSLERK